MNIETICAVTVTNSTFASIGADGCPYLSWTGARPAALIARLGLRLDIAEHEDDGSECALIVGVNLDNGDAERLVDLINAEVSDE